MQVPYALAAGFPFSNSKWRGLWLPSSCLFGKSFANMPLRPQDPRAAFYWKKGQNYALNCNRKGAAQRKAFFHACAGLTLPLCPL